MKTLSLSKIAQFFLTSACRMINLPDKQNSISKETRQGLKDYFGISLALFLFILFFQPFDFKNLEFNNQLLVIAGLGTIIFILLCLFMIVLPNIFPSFIDTKGETWVGNLTGLLIWILSSVAYAFYLRYVCVVYLTMYLMFKVVIICLAPFVVLKIINYQRSLNQNIQELKASNNKLKSMLVDFQNEDTFEAVELYSEHKTEKIAMEVKSLVLIKAADNYIEILYNDDDHIKKKLIRNTLKDVEDQLSKYNNFIRCHRTYIVNKYHIDKLVKTVGGYKIRLKSHNEELPVSRQFLLKVKEAIAKD
jgi:DNA-binding LytR/AlgR family response regulator